MKLCVELKKRLMKHLPKQFLYTIALLLIFFCGGYANAQTWEHIDAVNGQGVELVEMPNGDLLQLFYYWSPLDVTSEELLPFVGMNRFSNTGDLIWSNFTNIDEGIDFLHPRELISLAEGGFFVLGEDVSGYENFAIRNDEGALQLSGFSFSEEGRIEDVIEVEDGFVFVGSTPGVASDALIQKYDQEMNLVWTETYGLPDVDDNAADIIRTEDGGYAVIGQRNGDGDIDVFFLKMSEDGELEYSKNININANDQVYAVKEVDGDFVVMSYSPGDGVYLTRFNESSTIWQNGYDIMIADKFGRGGDHFTISPEGGFVICGFTLSIPDTHARLVFVSEEGDLIETIDHERPEASVYHEIIALSTGGYALTGFYSDEYGVTWDFEDEDFEDQFGTVNHPLIVVIDEYGKFNNVSLSGRVYEDANGNCVFDIGEAVLPNQIISLNAGGQLAITDADGWYSFQTDTGSHFLSYYPDYPWEIACSGPGTAITVTSPNSTISDLNFALAPTVACPQSVLNISTSTLRPCETAVYNIQIFNQGSAPLDSISLQLFIDPSLSFVTMNSDATGSIILNETTNAYDVVIDQTIGVGEAYVFEVVLEIPCDIPLGATLCVEGVMNDAAYCSIDDSAWDNSNIEVRSECDGAEVIFRIQNTGAGDMSEEVPYAIFEDEIIGGMLEGIMLEAGEEIEITRPANGSTWRLITAQTSSHPFVGVDIPQSAVERCGEEDPSLGFITAFPDNDLLIFKDIHCQEVVGSYDPNDKQVFPKGRSYYQYIENDTKLEYQIRFQNTGTAPAYRVVLKDTIDTDELNLASLELGVSSHPYTCAIEQNNILVFTFDPIELPDSTTNLAESQGYVNYKIRQNQYNDCTAEVTNRAHIYFDYNLPIATNQVVQHYKCDKLPVELMSFYAHPNPGTQIKLSWITASEAYTYSFEIESSENGQDFNTVGEVLASADISQNPLHYTFTDTETSTSTGRPLYYRLKIKDLDGRFEYSPVIAVVDDLPQNENHRLYFNAADNQLQLINIPAHANVSLQLFSLSGQSFSYENKTANDKISVNTLPRGVYLYQILDGERILSTDKILIN